MQSVFYILSITYDTFCIFAFLRFDFHNRNAASLDITPKPAWYSALSPLHFEISSSKCCVARHSSSKFASALSLLHFDVPSSKCCVVWHSSSKLVLLSLLCILMFHHRNATSLGIAQVSLTLRSLLCILQNGIIK